MRLLSLLEAKRKSGEVWYELLRQSPTLEPSIREIPMSKSFRRLLTATATFALLCGTAAALAEEPST
jgi:hypothetical protein